MKLVRLPTPTTQRLALSSVGLVALLVVAQPDATAALGGTGRTLYWALHVALGVLALRFAGVLLTHLSQTYPFRQWVLCGVLGTALAAPGFAALEWLWPLPGDGEIDDLLDRLAQYGWIGVVLAEFVGTLPWVMSGWLLISGPLWQNAAPQTVSTASVSPDGDETAHNVNVCDTASAVTSGANVEAEQQRLRDRLPSRALGEIISISADLHYLHVTTTRGRYTVLGRLRDAVAELASNGMQVHRSHWVAFDHIERVIKRGSSAVCVLSTGERVPISRRRIRTVMETIGEGVQGSIKSIGSGHD